MSELSARDALLKRFRIVDADTVDDPVTGERIRFHGVNAPEAATPQGKAASARTAASFNQGATLTRHGTDPYGRTVGEFRTPDGRSVNEEMVRAGNAPIDYNRTGKTPYGEAYNEYLNANDAKAQFTAGREQVLRAQGARPDTSYLAEGLRPEQRERGIMEETAAGIRRGTDTVQAGLYGAVSALGSALPADSEGRFAGKTNALQRFGERGYMRNQEQAAENPATHDLKSAYEAGPGGLIQWAFGAIGEAVPSLAAMAVGGAGGAAAGVATRMGGRMLANTIRKRFVAQGIRNLEANAAAKNFVANLPTHAAKAGAFGASAGMQGGHVFEDIKQQFGHEAPGTAAVAGGLMGALDFLSLKGFVKAAMPGPGDAARRSTIQGERGHTVNEESLSLLKRVAREMGVGSLREGATEAAQELIALVATESENPDQSRPIWERVNTPENRMRLLEAAAAGTVFGGAMGAGSGLAGGLRARTTPAGEADPAAGDPGSPDQTNQTTHRPSSTNPVAPNDENVTQTTDPQQENGSSDVSETTTGDAQEQQHVKPADPADRRRGDQGPDALGAQGPVTPDGPLAPPGTGGGLTGASSPPDTVSPPPVSSDGAVVPAAAAPDGSPPSAPSVVERSESQSSVSSEKGPAPTGRATDPRIPMEDRPSDEGSTDIDGYQEYEGQPAPEGPGPVPPGTGGAAVAADSRDTFARFQEYTQGKALVTVKDVAQQLGLAPHEARTLIALGELNGLIKKSKVGFEVVSDEPILGSEEGTPRGPGEQVTATDRDRTAQVGEPPSSSTAQVAGPESNPSSTPSDKPANPAHPKSSTSKTEENPPPASKEIDLSADLTGEESLADVNARIRAVSDERNALLREAKQLEADKPKGWLKQWTPLVRKAEDLKGMLNRLNQGRERTAKGIELPGAAPTVERQAHAKEISNRPPGGPGRITIDPNGLAETGLPKAPKRTLNIEAKAGPAGEGKREYTHAERVALYDTAAAAIEQVRRLNKQLRVKSLGTLNRRIGHKEIPEGGLADALRIALKLREELNPRFRVPARTAGGDIDMRNTPAETPMTAAQVKALEDLNTQITELRDELGLTNNRKLTEDESRDNLLALFDKLPDELVPMLKIARVVYEAEGETLTQEQQTLLEETVEGYEGRLDWVVPEVLGREPGDPLKDLREIYQLLDATQREQQVVDKEEMGTALAEKYDEIFARDVEMVVGEYRYLRDPKKEDQALDKILQGLTRHDDMIMAYHSLPLDNIDRRVRKDISANLARREASGVEHGHYIVRYDRRREKFILVESLDYSTLNNAWLRHPKTGERTTLADLVDEYVKIAERAVRTDEKTGRKGIKPGTKAYEENVLEMTEYDENGKEVRQARLLAERVRSLGKDLYKLIYQEDPRNPMAAFKAGLSFLTTRHQPMILNDGVDLDSKIIQYDHVNKNSRAAKPLTYGHARKGQSFGVGKAMERTQALREKRAADDLLGVLRAQDTDPDAPASQSTDILKAERERAAKKYGVSKAQVGAIDEKLKKLPPARNSSEGDLSTRNDLLRKRRVHERNMEAQRLTRWHIDRMLATETPLTLEQAENALNAYIEELNETIGEFEHHGQVMSNTFAGTYALDAEDINFEDDVVAFARAQEEFEDSRSGHPSAIGEGVDEEALGRSRSAPPSLFQKKDMASRVVRGSGPLKAMAQDLLDTLGVRGVEVALYGSRDVHAMLEGIHDEASRLKFQQGLARGEQAAVVFDGNQAFIYLDEQSLGVTSAVIEPSAERLNEARRAVADSQIRVDRLQAVAERAEGSRRAKAVVALREERVRLKGAQETLRKRMAEHTQVQVSVSPQARAALGHELGHVVYRKLLAAEHEKQSPVWQKLTEAYKKTDRSKSLEEWFADEVAQWARLGRKPSNIIESFKTRVVKMAEKVLGWIFKSTPRATVFAYLDGLTLREAGSSAAKIARFLGSDAVDATGYDTGMLIETLRHNPLSRAVKSDVAFLGLTEPAKRTAGKISQWLHGQSFIARTLQDTGTSVHYVYDRMIKTSDGWLRTQANRDGELIKAFQALAEITHFQAGGIRGEGLDSQGTGHRVDLGYQDAKGRELNYQIDLGGEAMLDAVRREQANWVYKLEQSLEGIPDEDLAWATRELQKENGDIPLNVQKVAGFLSEFHQYAKDKLPRLGFRKHFFPRIYDVTRIQADPEGWKKALMEHNGLDERTADNMTRSIIEGQGFADPTIQDRLLPPGAPGHKKRNLKWNMKGTDAGIAAAQAYMSEDLRANLYTYLHAMIKRAEFESRFGDVVGVDPNGNDIWESDARFERLMDIAAAQGATQSQIDHARVIMNAYLGRLGADINPKLRQTFSLITAYQNVRLLPFAVLSSLVDLASPLIRSNGDFKSALAGFREALKAYKKEGGALWDVARLHGLVHDGLAAGAVTERLNTPYMSAGVQKFNEKFFRAIGLSQFTNFARLYALATGREFLKKHATQPSKHSERYLKELGVDAATIKQWIEDGEPVWEGSQDGNATARQVQLALNQFVSQSVFLPDASQRPSWASDPHWMLVWNLKQFSWSFAKVILGRMGREIKARPEMKDKLIAALPLLMMFPLAMAGMALRDLLKYEMLPWREGKPEHLEKDWVDQSMTVISRAGVLGPLQLLFDAEAANQWGALFVTSLAGPTASQMEATFRNGFVASLPKAIPGISILPEERQILMEGMFGR